MNITSRNLKKKFDAPADSNQSIYERPALAAGACSMANLRMGQFIQCVRKSILLRDGGGMTDGQLLSCFVECQDTAAFEALLHRHSSMVWAVCRRVLRHPQDAEDAFQAVFLVLVRKAASIAARERLGGWLHGVAYRTALEARAGIARRRRKERRLEVIPQPEVRAEPYCGELLAVLDRELGRLPDKYRVPVILCELEGRSRKDVARQLGIPEGTLSSRLAYARKQLAAWLSCRGVAFSGGAMVLLLSREASANVSVSLILSTAKAARAFASGQTDGISAAAAGLTQGVLKTMSMFNLKAAVVALTVVTSFGIGGVAYRAAGAPAAPASAQADLEALKKENDLLKLNLEVVLEKVRSQETEIKSLRAQLETAKTVAWTGLESNLATNQVQWNVNAPAEVEQAIKAFRDASDKESRGRSAEALEKAMKKFREELK
jgi:RNA polymerase sigma factor (sigma-70 family)